jgi:hypothetical protein
MKTLTTKLSVSFLTLVAAASLAALTGCAAVAEPASDDSSPADEAATATSTSELRIRFSAEGDSCTVRTNPDGTTVPGTEKGLECCSTATPTDCVVILKPFPKAMFSF